MFADEFVRLLSICTGLSRRHEDVLGGHEGKLGLEVGFDGLGVDDQTGGDVVEDIEDAIEREEGFGEDHAAIGGVIERALEPLGGGGVERA